MSSELDLFKRRNINISERIFMTSNIQFPHSGLLENDVTKYLQKQRSYMI